MLCISFFQGMYNIDDILNWAKKIYLSDEKITKLCNGVVGGFANVIPFNPIDRALYKSMSAKSVHPFKMEYWMHYKGSFRFEYLMQPFHGASTAVIQRTISYGMYYPIYDIFEKEIEKTIKTKHHCTVITSVLACCFTGFLTSPLAAIKQTNWNAIHKNNMTKLALEMYKLGGMSAFFRGTKITMTREMAFGSVVGYSKNYNETNNFYLNCLYYFIATTVASPLNYARTMIYKSPIDSTISVRQVFIDLKTDIKTECHGSTIWRKIYHIAMRRFYVGFGTVRVAIGMSLSGWIYSYLNNINKKLEK